MMAHKKIPIACNRASADFKNSSPLMDGKYDRLIPDYENYIARRLDWDAESSQAGNFDERKESQ
jgi:hypothetical protein